MIFYINSLNDHQFLVKSLKFHYNPNRHQQSKRTMSKPTLQLQQQFDQLVHFRFDRQLYSQYRHRMIQNLAFFFTINRMYGRLFLACVVSFAPSSAAMAMWITRDIIIGGDTNNNSLIKSLNMFFFTIYQLVFVMLIHLALTRCTQLIHEPVKVLIATFVHNQHRTGDLRSRIKLIGDIDRLNIKNRYGFTYGKYGLVTLEAFVKVIYSHIYIYIYIYIYNIIYYICN